MKKGFTLLEVMICTSIIAIVAAISTPVLLTAKYKANVSSSTSRLRQLQISVKLYQSEMDGDGNYGSLYEMGLPDMVHIYSTRSELGNAFWHSPCGWNSQVYSSPNELSYVYRPDESDDFANYATRYQENIWLFADYACDDTGSPPSSKYMPHHALGVLLSGQLVNKRAAGDMFADSWWSKPVLANSNDPFGGN